MPKKKKRRVSKSTSVPLITLAGLALAGSQAAQGDVIPNVMAGNVQGALFNLQNNVMQNKIPIAVGIIGPILFRQLLGSKQIIKLGKVRVTTG